MKLETVIKATDLRIDNLIYIPKTDQHATIFTINKLLGVHVNDNLLVNLSFEEIEPIEITNEWLQKLGFKILNKVSNSYKKYVNDETKECFYVELYQVGRLDWIVTYFNSENNEISLKLNYVHQLQNLYQILSGEHLVLS